MEEEITDLCEYNMLDEIGLGELGARDSDSGVTTSTSRGWRKRGTETHCIDSWSLQQLASIGVATTGGRRSSNSVIPWYLRIVQGPLQTLEMDSTYDGDAVVLCDHFQYNYKR